MNHRESNEQIALISYSNYIPELRDNLIAIPNGGKRNIREAARMKKEGVRAGVHDLFLPISRGDYHGLWIEFKAAKPYNASYSKSQRLWETKMISEGFAAYCCKGTEEAIKVFSWYLSLSLKKPEIKKAPTLSNILNKNIGN